MKILYLITKSNWGGAQRYVFDLASELKDKHEVIVGLGGEGTLKINLEKENVRVISIKQLGRDVKASSDLKSFFDILKILKKEKPDVVHLNSSKIGIIGALACRVAGIKKIIFTAHGWAFNEDRPAWQKLLIKTIAYSTIILCHKTIAVSKNIADSFLRWPFTKNKIIVVHNGIEKIEFIEKEKALKELTSHSPILKEAIETTKEPLVVGMIGELHKIKGQIYAIEAIKDLLKEFPNILLLIIGGGEEEKKLNEAINKLELKRNVFLLGHIPKASRYLKAFDIFLLASLSEALAYVVLEAGQAGLPVVATNVGGIPEIISNNETGILIKSKNTKEIVLGIKCMIKNPENKKFFGEKLRSEIEAKFTLKNMLDGTTKIYNS